MSETEEKKEKVSHKFSPNQRILKAWHFKLVTEKGKFARGKYFNLWAHEDPQEKRGLPQPRFGVAVGKKVSLRANVRNLWKRRMREAFRNNQFRIKPNTDIVLKARAGQKPPAYQDMLVEFEKLLEKTESLK